jgi:hypothetical protein
MHGSMNVKLLKNSGLMEGKGLLPHGVDTLGKKL